MARCAYDDFRRDVLYALRPNPRVSNNSSAEVEAWETVKNSINDSSSTFAVAVYNVDEVAWGTPKAIGPTYQVVGGRFKQQTSSSLVADTTTGLTIAAPSQWTGQFVVSYKFSAWRAMWASILWFFELLARLATVAVVVALLALVVYYVPWSRLASSSVAAGSLLHRNVTASVFSESASATPSPVAGYGTSRVVVGKSSSRMPD